MTRVVFREGKWHADFIDAKGLWRRFEVPARVSSVSEAQSLLAEVFAKVQRMQHGAQEA